MSHPRLFDGIRHQAHSDTSREAAERILPDLTRLQRQVLDHLRAMGPHGATDKECQRALQMQGSTQRPRRIELVNMGAVIDGERRRDGSAVWVAVDCAEPCTADEDDERGRCAVCGEELHGRQRYFCGYDCRMTWHGRKG